MSDAKKANNGRRVLLDLDEGEERYIDYVGGPHPYLWIGTPDKCFGCVPDNLWTLKKLRQMIDDVITERTK